MQSVAPFQSEAFSDVCETNLIIQRPRLRHMTQMILINLFIHQTMIEDRNYVEEEVAEDLLDLIKEYEAEIKKLSEREKALYKSLQASLGDSPTAQIEEYVRVKIDRSLRLFELDLRTRYADEEAAASKAVDRIFKEYA